MASPARPLISPILSAADEMSRFYQMLLNGGELDGLRIFEPRTVRRAVDATARRGQARRR